MFTVDSYLVLKANVADVYTKALVDSYSALKANASNAISTNILQGQTAYLSGNVSMAPVLHLQNNLNVAGTSTFNGAVNFVGAVSGLPVYTSGSINLGNVANTAPSGLPISTATQTALNLKAHAADVYTKTQDDTLFALKANVADVYTTTLVDSYLATKANIADSYNKAVIDTYVSLTASAADVYTKTIVDRYLALKANSNNAIFTDLLQGQSALFVRECFNGFSLEFCWDFTF